MLACGSPAEKPSSSESGATESKADIAAPFVDPVRASPQIYRTLMTAPGVRVLGARWAAGARDEPHSHSIAFWYALTDAVLGIEAVDTPPLGRRIAAGESGVQPPVQLHAVTNRGDRAAELLLFEIEPRASRLSEAPAGSAPLALAVSNRFQLLEAHGGYRLLLATLEPKQKDRLHSHPRSLLFALTAARLRITESDRSTVDLQLEPGAVRLLEPTKGHTVANLGSSRAAILMLELPAESIPGAV